MNTNPNNSFIFSISLISLYWVKELNDRVSKYKVQRSHDNVSESDASSFSGKTFSGAVAEELGSNKKKTSFNMSRLWWLPALHRWNSGQSFPLWLRVNVEKHCHGEWPKRHILCPVMWNTSFTLVKFQNLTHRTVLGVYTDCNTVYKIHRLETYLYWSGTEPLHYETI